MLQKNKFKNYILVFSPVAKKELKALEHKIAEKIDKKLRDLIAGVENLDIKKMQGYENTYRLRCGDYRVIYAVKKHIITILVLTVDHRKDAYKDF